MSIAWRGVVGAVVAVLIAVFAACGPSDSSASTDVGRSDAPGVDATDAKAGWPDVIRLGLVPTEGGTDIRERFEPLRTHLSEALGRPVETVSASSYNGVVTAMANDQVEFCYYGPKSYVLASQNAGAEAVVLELSKGGVDGYRSILIVPKDSEIEEVGDAKGCVFAFTDPNSTSGCLIPSIVLRELTGEAPEDFFSEVRFSGSHGTSVLQVAQGELDIAATNDLDFGRMVEKGAVRRDDVRIIYESDPIPGAPWAARRELPATLKEAFTEAMLALNDKPEVLERFQNGGFRRTSDEEYDIIRAASKLLKEQESEGG